MIKNKNFLRNSQTKIKIVSDYLGDLEKQKMKNKQPHTPVLLNEVLGILKPNLDESYLDLTAGYGGHAREIIERTASPKRAVLVDRDDNALATLADIASEGVELVHDDFLSATNQLIESRQTFDMILMDLGVSSPHLDIASRGFSFQSEGPLDMRMDQRQELTAEKLVNAMSEQELANLIFRYGEEKASRRIAKVICAKRPFKNTTELAEEISAIMPKKWKIHPATRTFQAIRLYVNREIELLEQALPNLPKLLNRDGRLAIISFHSLEDRIVKQFLHERSVGKWDSEMMLVNKKPIMASEDELVSNPRSRSAKLRGAVKK